MQKYCYNITVSILYFIMSGTSRRRRCRNDPDVFRYVCGEYMMKKYQFNVCDFTKRAYKSYFGIKLSDQDKS